MRVFFSVIIRECLLKLNTPHTSSTPPILKPFIFYSFLLKFISSHFDSQNYLQKYGKEIRILSKAQSRKEKVRELSGENNKRKKNKKLEEKEINLHFI